MAVPYAEVIGDPVAHSKSPPIHRFWLEKLGIEGDYRAVRVTPEELPAYLSSRPADPDWRGCNVTMPHKERVWSLLDCRRRLGRQGTVNCVARGPAGIEGHGFDADALMRTLPPSGPEDRLCVIGAGGAARAVIEAREIASRSPVSFLVRSPERARALVRDYGLERSRIREVDEAAEALCGCVGLINASPLGMAGAPPMPEAVLRNLERLQRGAFVYDMVYVPAETGLLRRARALELRTVDGLTMLIEQAALSFEKFFHAPAPREHDPELRRLLAS